MIHLFLLKLVAPHQVFLLRGNHDVRLMDDGPLKGGAERADFKAHCAAYGGDQLWEKIMCAHRCLASAALSSDRSSQRYCEMRSIRTALATTAHRAGGYRGIPCRELGRLMPCTPNRTNVLVLSLPVFILRRGLRAMHRQPLCRLGVRIGTRSGLLRCAGTASTIYPWQP